MARFFHMIKIKLSLQILLKVMKIFGIKPIKDDVYLFSCDFANAILSNGN